MRSEWPGISKPSSAASRSIVSGIISDSEINSDSKIEINSNSDTESTDIYDSSIPDDSTSDDDSSSDRDSEIYTGEDSNDVTMCGTSLCSPEEDNDNYVVTICG